MKMGMYICIVKVRHMTSVPDSCGQSDTAVFILDVNIQAWYRRGRIEEGTVQKVEHGTFSSFYARDWLMGPVV